MSVMGLAGFVEGFAGARKQQQDKAEREKIGVRQDRMIAAMERQAAMPAMGLPGTAPGGALPATAPMPIEADYIRAGLIQRGMPEHIADGFVWNARDESGFNAAAVGDNGNAFGIWQHNGPRRAALEAFARQAGKPMFDPDVQMDYLMHELNGSEAAAWGKIQRATTPNEAAAAVLNHFERPAEGHRARRERAYLGAAPVAAKRATVRAGRPVFGGVADNVLDAAIAAHEARGGGLPPLSFGLPKMERPR